MRMLAYFSGVEGSVEEANNNLLMIDIENKY